MEEVWREAYNLTNQEYCIYSNNTVLLTKIGYERNNVTVIYMNLYTNGYLYTLNIQ
jgi:hypothetical protein